MGMLMAHRHAAECLRIAEGTANAQHRAALTDMAQSWLLLARQAEKNLFTEIVYETASKPHAPIE